MINEILQWVVLLWCVWAINNLGSTIEKYAEIFETMYKWKENEGSAEDEYWMRSKHWKPKKDETLH